MENLETIDPSPFQNLLGNGEMNLIPESFITTVTIGFIVLNVLGVLFLIAYIFSLVRKWKVQSAVLHMQKDLAEIKLQLAGQTAEKNTPNDTIPTNAEITRNQ